MGACKDALMLVLLDSNIYFSALISPLGAPGRIVHAWRMGKFQLLTCQQQIGEIREASRNPKFSDLFQPHQIGKMLNLKPEMIGYYRRNHSAMWNDELNKENQRILP